MARFVYRLQKVFELRERKKKAQEQKVIDAQKKVREIEVAIEEKKQEIRQLRHDMLQSHHTLMNTYDQYLHLQNKKLETMGLDLMVANEDLELQRKLLIKAQADMEALIKHKEKAKEEWLEEEKQAEMKALDEVAGQRYFRAQLARHEEEAQDEALRLIEAAENGEVVWSD